MLHGLLYRNMDRAKLSIAELVPSKSDIVQFYAGAVEDSHLCNTRIEALKNIAPKVCSCLISWCILLHSSNMYLNNDSCQLHRP